MEAEKCDIDQFGELAEFEFSAQFSRHRPALVFGKRLGINLIIARAGRNFGWNGVKIADTSFVDELPIEQNKLIEAIDEKRHRFEEAFVEVIVNGASTGKRDLAFFGVAAKENSDFNFHVSLKDTR